MRVADPAAPAGPVITSDGRKLFCAAAVEEMNSTSNPIDGAATIRYWKVILYVREPESGSLKRSVDRYGLYMFVPKYDPLIDPTPDSTSDCLVVTLPAGPIRK